MLTQHVLKRPILLTEKATRLRENENKVVFEVARDANKIEIKEAVEKLFGVQVVDVNTLNTRGHMKRMGRGYSQLRNKKKAIITLKEGSTIEFFEEEKAAG
ncbi:MAG: 50S ribosomal protein L23 [Polyangiaceae bacterium]|nr:50S ribosomal protein L23 [Polyangiaceae bacterium]